MIAIILSRKDFRDYDQIVSVYTQEKGKMNLLVRGVKKIVSKNSAYLEPFSIVNITVEKGKEVAYLTRVQSENYLRNIREDLAKSLVAFYLVSLVDKLFSEAEVDNRFFVFLRVFLEYLDSLELLDDQKTIFIIDVFVVNLLSFLGFKLSSDEKIINSEFLPYIQVFEKGDLQEVFSLNFDVYLAKKIHKLVYDSLLSYTERKVADWAKTCII
ncbi:MAG: DNA repair protein RecO [Candidatus Magasanikbacteria bacterium CG10_big_fil_rev_8_21_14_0_10_36_16]|uniref:DNA repair protein RecO n=1 Tax=Candidatus Magasanikbacteria bacterium CG10_big_fil_rev_8_21_14_0_10_36_16 TaxID=1974645 RepID=A0A2H0TYH6_9BACT|nr:MAG: DNA repair protein RecO [Candidatus Magasanikbacteria bacterium CG10_big_fil_rev_8_21_14_0_10_36_16]